MKNMGRKILLVVAAVVFLAGCSKGGAGDPKGVAQKFWEAVKAGDVAKVAPYVTKAGFEMLKNEKPDDAGMKKEGDFSFGAVKVDGDRAKVETKITDKGFSIPFETIVVKEGGQWKVDADQTMASAMTGAMGAMGQALGEGMKAAGDAMEQAGKELAAEANAAPPPPTPAAPSTAAPSAAVPEGKVFGIGDPVKVEWKGKWWPASVIEVSQKGRWKIHYDGYDNSWDEWVGPERIQAKK